MQQLCLFDVEILFSGGCIVILYYWVKGKAKIKSFPSHVACTALERQGIGDFWRQVGSMGKVVRVVMLGKIVFSQQLLTRLLCLIGGELQ